MKAIVYTTNTGSTKRCAGLLGNETGLPAYPLREAEKTLSEKENRTQDEDDMLDMMLHGGERVKLQNLSAVLGWYKTQEARA